MGCLGKKCFANGNTYFYKSSAKVRKIPGKSKYFPFFFITMQVFAGFFRRGGTSCGCKMTKMGRLFGVSLKYL